MRVIAGQYKGRRLFSINDHRIRPATDRVKESIFNILASRLDFVDSTVLDLFAGTGSLGIEALSRGARRAVFVESSGDAVRTIERNLEALNAQPSSTVIHSDAMRYMKKSTEQFTIVFADPPYAYRETGRLPDLVFERRLVGSSGFLVIEHQSQVMFRDRAGFTVGLARKFGSTVVSFFQAKANSH